MIKNFKPTSFKVLDISTAHITKSDADALTDMGKHREDRGRIGDLLVYEYTEGMFVYAGCSEKATHGALSKACLDILEWAWVHNYRFVRFDGDGEIYADLPAFNWETGAVGTGADHLPYGAQ